MSGLKTNQSEFSRQKLSSDSCCGLTSKTPPIPSDTQNGQSVENTLLTPSYWYAARITYGRAHAVYKAIKKLDGETLTPYIPVVKKQVYHIENGMASVSMEERPVHSGLLFINASPSSYRKLFHDLPRIPGLTPFYDHFSVSATGRNDYLVVPDRQFESFRRIIESGHEDILIDQSVMPTYLAGKHVLIVSGPFAGVEGTLFRWKHQRRVFVDLGSLGKYGTGYIQTCDVEILP